MSDPQTFKIDRSQRMHSHGVIVRVYQIVGTDDHGWDTNKDSSSQDHGLYPSRTAAEESADDHLFIEGHVCGENCYPWRSFQRE